MTKNRKIFFYDFPPGRMMIAENGAALTHLHFSRESSFEGARVKESALLKEAALQLEQYFAGKRKAFDLPLALKGTAFQLKVWRALQEIPYGQTRSYGEIAQAVGNKRAARAVGGANNKNPISIIIPCHRVIGADGKLVGYGGGLEKKVYLLALEKRHSGEREGPG